MYNSPDEWEEAPLRPGPALQQPPRTAARIGARGNDLPDAYLAAMAIEAGPTLWSADRGFARFPNLRWRHPLEPG